MSVNLENLLISINIICTSGKLNVLDMEELGKLYRKIYGHKAYIFKQNSTKSSNEGKSNEFKSESTESNEFKSESTESNEVKSESTESNEVKSESTESNEVKSESTESNEIKSESTESNEIKSESTESNDNSESSNEVKSDSNESNDEKYYIEYVESLDIEDIVKIHNILNKYSKIEGIFIDTNSTSIKLIINNLKDLVQNHINSLNKEEKKEGLKTINESEVVEI